MNTHSTHPTRGLASASPQDSVSQAPPQPAQLAAEMGVSQGKANYCLRALVEKGQVKLGNFSKNPNKGKYAYILTPAGLEEPPSPCASLF